jgi:hypothetical protein
MRRSWSRRTGRIGALLAVVVLVGSCSGDGDTPGPAPLASGSCPDAANLRASAGDIPEFTLDVASSFALRNDDDTLYGAYYDVVFADFELEPTTFFDTESGGRAIEIEIYNRDKTLPGTGTFDFEGDQNTFFQPSLSAEGKAYLATTLGRGGTLTVSEANDEELCGSIDVSDGSVTIQGVFRAPVVVEPTS